MPTISELMEGKVPGSVRVRLASWYPKEYFRPFFQAMGQWYGINEYDNVLSFDDYTQFSSVKESNIKKKPKIKRWLWVDPKTGDSSAQFFSEKEYEYFYSRTASYRIKVPWSEMEFDE